MHLVYLDNTIVKEMNLELPIGGDNQRLVSYDKETVEATEIGYKGLHLDETLQVFASIYQYDYDGYQDELQQFDPIRGGLQILFQMLMELRILVLK